MAKINEETGEVEFEESDWESENNPYQKRFNDYRSEADRRATEFSNQQKLLADLTSEDADTARAAAQQLGLEFAEEPDEDETGNPDVAELKAKYAELEQKLTAREQQEAQRDLAAAIDNRLEAMKLDKTDGDLVLAFAVTMPPLDDGMPDLQGAYDAIQARDEARFDGWRKSKRVTNVQRGKTGTENKNIADMTDEERLDYVMAQHDMD